jgi:hypothetical protein
MITLGQRLGALFCGVLVLALFSAPTRADLVTTEEVTASAQAEKARERIKAFAQRPELAKALEAQGVAADQVQLRVDAMTDKEVLALADKIGSLPAGGRLHSDDLIIILLLIVILVIAL